MFHTANRLQAYHMHTAEDCEDHMLQDSAHGA